MKVFLFFEGFEKRRVKSLFEKMHTKGYVFTKTGWHSFYFEEVEPKEVTYAFDWQALNKNERIEYLSLKSDWTFTESIGTRYWYFKEKSSSDKGLNFFNDNESKSQFYYRQIKTYILWALTLDMLSIPVIYNPVPWWYANVAGYLNILISFYLYYLAIRYYLRFKKVKSNLIE